MTFYCIYNTHVTDSMDLSLRVARLRVAASKLGVDFHELDEAVIDFSQLPAIHHADCLYNVARGAVVLEQYLLRGSPRSIYRNHSATVIQNNKLADVAIEAVGIRVPVTIWYGNNDPDMLARYVSHVGGFPVVVKVDRGSSGVGTLFVPDRKTLLPIADFLHSSGHRFAIREFIPAPSSERLVVLADKVIAAATRPLRQDDMRSTIAPSLFAPYEPSENECQLAIAAAHAANYNFAGVDLLTSRVDNKSYVLEVNAPHNFTGTENVAGVDIALRFVRWIESGT